MKTRLFRSIMVGALLAVFAGSSTAHAEPSADDKKKARSLMEEGDALALKRDHQAALEKYRAADALMRVPTTGLEVARALAALGRLVEARDAALAVARLPTGSGEHEAFAKARAEAGRLAGEVAARIPSVQVVVRGVAPQTRIDLRIDGKPVPAAAATLPQKLDPGEHEIVVAVPGHPQATRKLTLGEGAKEQVEIQLGSTAGGKAGSGAVPGSDAGTAPSRTSPLVYVGFGVSGAGLLVGSVTGVMSLGKASSAKDQCDGNACPPAAKDDIDSSKSLATVSNIGFVVAIVGAGVGVYGLLSSKPRTEQPAAQKPRVEPVVGARFVGVTGRF